MKIAFLVIIFQFLLSSLHSSAQENILEKKISCTFIEDNLETIFNKIRKRHGITFIYSDDIIPKSYKVTLEVQEVSLKNILDQIITTHFPNIEYLCIQNKIIIRDRERHRKKILLPPESPNNNLLGRNKTHKISGPETTKEKDIRTANKTTSTVIKTYPVIKLSALHPKVKFTCLFSDHDSLHSDLVIRDPSRLPSRSSGTLPTSKSLSAQSRHFHYSVDAGYGLCRQLQTKYFTHKGFVNLNLDYSLAKKYILSTGTGLSFSTMAGDNFDILNDTSIINHTQVDTINYNNDSIQVRNKFSGNVLFLEIPIMVNYMKSLSDNWSLYVTSGLSNLFLLSEKYRSDSIPKIEFGSSTPWLLLFRLSLSLEKKINKGLSLKIQPTLNVPLNGSEFDKLKYTSFEVRLICTFIL